ncbi:MAG: sigma-70 family RNA polymerase sigma factor, partial [Proteobacteria bacterium]|nr:sigma-70 family RNA polymerase sigma factor [Pseudomonadota bacterium]
MSDMGTGFDQAVDPTVLARAKAGDSAAHETLFRCFGAAVFTLARRLVKRADIAEEILQETFLDLFRQVGSYRQE